MSASKSMIRRLYFDVADDGASSSALAGLPPMSPDVLDMEQRASSKRLERLEPVIPMIDSLSGSLAELAVAIFIHMHQQMIQQQHPGAIVDMDPMARHEVLIQHKELIQRSVLSILSVMVDDGILTITDKEAKDE